ncbi:type II toxin-antitoxin system RelB family antitoxin [Candidatus Paracaedibacter symbiosus]|uniref:type II toxin-antitoxin system RelB family antitoxin n=1 Tax=Candidatus Paracaedibacter symbiosus TaxID=244582 RepID=UPI000509602D|nr:ribbon-helix-helix domain-containing protein [Candidatus Paracaedibacter symbiosus]
MLAVRLSEELDRRLKTIAKKTHRTKTHYVEEAIKAYLDAHERDLVAIAEYEEQRRNGTLKTYSLAEIKERHGLD